MGEVSTEMPVFEQAANIFNLSTLSIPSLRITDIIDIVIVAVIIYVIVCWVKETRAWALVKGLLIIGVISFLSSAFNLYTLSWLIEKTFSVGVIAIIILFQPELRKALEQIGTGGFKNISEIIKLDDGDSLTRESVNAIVEACVEMSKARTGALIVMEREVPSGDYVKDAISIEALISSQLIINIFEDKTPLHDDAMVIKNNRIKAATCILPLTHSQIGLELGTRHRAAVGCSEVSDAYIIVVSEETGGISLAYEGKLRKNITERELRRTLMSLVSDNKASNKKLLRGKFKNEEDN